MLQSPQMATGWEPCISIHNFLFKEFQMYKKVKKWIHEHPYILHLAPLTIDNFATFASFHSLCVYTYYFGVNLCVLKDQHRQEWGNKYKKRSSSWEIKGTNEWVSKNTNKLPWLVWLSGLSAHLLTKRSLVWFPIRAHAWVAGQVPSWGSGRGNWWCISRT